MHSSATFWSSLPLTLALVTVLGLTQAAPSSYTNTAENELDEEFIDLSTYDKKMYGHPDKTNTGTLLESYRTDVYTQNPEELGSYLEGDILIPTAMDNSTDSGAAPERNGIVTQSYRWPGAIVPYEIRGSFTSRDLAIIQHAFDEYHTRTCVRFRRRTNEPNYISIVSGKSGCWSSVGRLGGRQEVNLQSPSCLMKYGTTIHELMHALGFFHEQNRHERDQYIRVLLHNVKPNALVNFHKASVKEAYAFGVPYDYASVMHYSPTSFSKNGQPTIMALKKTKETAKMGQRSGLSNGDILKINAMYRCH